MSATLLELWPMIKCIPGTYHKVDVDVVENDRRDNPYRSMHSGSYGRARQLVNSNSHAVPVLECHGKHTAKDHRHRHVFRIAFVAWPESVSSLDMESIMFYTIEAAGQMSALRIGLCKRPSLYTLEVGPGTGIF